jgi:5-methylcytosine-specific restriction enzyme A
MAVRKAYLSKHPLCRHCEQRGIITPAHEIDHIVPLFKGGHDAWSNYQALCVECHKIKTAQDANTKQGCDANGYPPGWT